MQDQRAESAYSWGLVVLVTFAISAISLGLMTLMERALSTNGEELRRTWNFDSESVGGLPNGFVVGTLFDGRPAGDWKIMTVKEAPSPPHVFSQQMNTGAEHAYKTVLVEGTEASDLDLQVSFLAIGGKGDMGGGLIWRVQDDRNYYLARANPLEQNIRAYRVVKGVRHQLASVDQIVPIHQWHTLRVMAQGKQFQVYYDARPVLSAKDSTFSTGRIGLWTKSDAVTYFDDLQLIRLN